MIGHMAHGEDFYYIDFCEGDEDNVSFSRWFSSPYTDAFCNQMNRKGLAFKTRQEAVKAAKKMLEALSEEVIANE